MKKENLQVSVPYEITLLSNNAGVESRLDEFQYLMKLHYSQTGFKSKLDELKVSVPYEITLLSNSIFVELFDVLFQYLMKLHYSQTTIVSLCE